MIIFISGPITGLKLSDVRRRFRRFDKYLTKRGHTVMNPAKLIPEFRPFDIPHWEYVKICLTMLESCDSIYMLDGWQGSTGARKEREYAVENGLSVFKEGDIK